MGEPVVVQYTEVVGKKLTLLIDADQSFKETAVDVTIPDASTLFNFKVSGEEYDLVVLDPYGDETLSDDLKKKLFLTSDYVLAIDRVTGEVCTALFWRYPNGDIAIVISAENPNVPGKSIRVPRKYRKRLDELLRMKRPFCFSVDEKSLLNVIEREEGYQNMRENITLNLYFNQRFVQINGELYREVSYWKEF
jgi:hypothetical protein